MSLKDDLAAGSSLAAPHVRTRGVIDPSRIGPGLNAHRLVAETAVKIAQEFWELYMGANNELYRAFMSAHPNQKAAMTTFVALVAPNCLEDARLALTECLSKGDDVVPPAMKDEIAEALILDSPLRASRKKAAEHMPSSLLH